MSDNRNVSSWWDIIVPNMSNFLTGIIDKQVSNDQISSCAETVRNLHDSNLLFESDKQNRLGKPL